MSDVSGIRYSLPVAGPQSRVSPPHLLLQLHVRCLYVLQLDVNVMWNFFLIVRLWFKLFKAPLLMKFDAKNNEFEKNSEFEKTGKKKKKKKKKKPVPYLGQGS